MALIKHEVKGDVRVVAIDVVRLVDEAMIDQCKQEILEVLDTTEESNLLVHFGRVTFMSSAALGMLIRVNKKCKEYDVVLKLCNISPDIRQVFKITAWTKSWRSTTTPPGRSKHSARAADRFSAKTGRQATR